MSGYADTGEEDWDLQKEERRKGLISKVAMKERKKKELGPVSRVEDSFKHFASFIDF